MTTPRLVLHIVGDDIGAEQDPSFGRNAASPGTATLPMLQLFADQGVRIDKFFAESFCSPSRTCHFTGRHTEDTGVGDLIESDDDQPMLLSELTLVEILKIYFGADIQTAVFGKWHMGNPQVGGKMSPNEAGFDYGFTTPRNCDYFSTTLDCQGEDYFPYGRYIPQIITDAAISWVKRFASQRNKRGFLYFPLHLPHDPYHRPNADLYDTGRWVLGSQVAPDQSNIAGILPYGKAMLEAADTLAYRLLNAIPEWLMDETVVIWHSDNGSDTRVLSSESYPASLGGGAYVGGHGKRSAFDPGIRTPAYVYSPNTNLVTAPGRVLNQNTMQSLDWYATTLDYFGVPWKEIVAKRFGGKGVSPADRSISQITSFQTNTTKLSRAYAKGGIFTPNGFNRGTSPGTRWITDGTNKLTWAAGSTAFSTSKLYNIVNNPRETAVEAEPAGGSAAAARKALEAQWSTFYASMPQSY